MTITIPTCNCDCECAKMHLPDGACPACQGVCCDQAINCGCYIRENERAWCSWCVRRENESAHISPDTILYLLWCCFWAVIIFQPWEKV